MNAQQQEKISKIHIHQKPGVGRQTILIDRHAGQSGPNLRLSSGPWGVRNPSRPGFHVLFLKRNTNIPDPVSRVTPRKRLLWRTPPCLWG